MILSHSTLEFIYTLFLNQFIVFEILLLFPKTCLEPCYWKMKIFLILIDFPFVCGVLETYNFASLFTFTLWHYDRCSRLTKWILLGNWNIIYFGCNFIQFVFHLHVKNEKNGKRYLWVMNYLLNRIVRITFYKSN